MTATDFNYETSNSRGSNENEIEINGELRNACDPSEITDLNERLDNTHVRSRSDSKKRRLEESDSHTATFIEGTVIERTVKFEKCHGFQPQVDKIYSNFPFQMFDHEDDIGFVFENINFHSKRCCDNNYCLLDNLDSTKINTSCLALAYDMKFNNIIKRAKEYNKYYNFQYTTFKQFTQKVCETNDKLKDLKLHYLTKDYQIIAYNKKICLYKRFTVLLSTKDFHVYIN